MKVLFLDAQSYLVALESNWHHANANKKLVFFMSLGVNAQGPKGTYFATL